MSAINAAMMAPCLGNQRNDGGGWRRKKTTKRRGENGKIIQEVVREFASLSCNFPAEEHVIGITGRALTV